MALRLSYLRSMARPVLGTLSASSAVTTSFWPGSPRRFYRGQATDPEAGATPLSAQEQALLRVAEPKSQAILKEHLQLPSLDAIPVSSLGAEKQQQPKELLEEIRRKRLIYRSKQRGWLEVDLLLGTWASENVPKLSVEELDQFEDVVNMETIDIYNIITLRVDVPDGRKTPAKDTVLERIQAWASDHPLGKADPEQYKKVKASAKLI